MGRLTNRHRRLRDVMLAGGVVALISLRLVAIGSGWPPAVDIAVLLGLVVNVATLCWLVWAMATRRIGLSHWTPSQQQHQIGAKRIAARRARAEAMKQQRLEAALSHGSYRPEPTVPPGSDELARARQELLEAIERHGGLSPQARAAAEKAKGLSG